MQGMAQDGASPGAQASLAALVLANPAPIALVAAGVVFFYWLENLVIGFYNLLRIAAATRLAPGEKVFPGGFFAVHYGIFCLGYVMSPVDVFGYPGLAPGQPAPAGGFPPFDIIAEPGLIGSPRVWWPLAALVASHGVPFVADYVRGGERLSATQGTLMGRPYGRIMAMHLWLFAGGFLVMKWNAPRAALLTLVALKIVVDAGSHAYLHGRPGGRAMKRGS